MNQYSAMLASMRSRGIASSGAPSAADQAWNFSTIQAAKPVGESVKPNARVWGRVPCIH